MFISISLSFIVSFLSLSAQDLSLCWNCCWDLWLLSSI